MEVIISELNNGLRVATQKFPESKSVTTGMWIRSGSRNEALEEHGLAHMLEHMAFKGTTTRNAREIAQAIENVGGEINAATSVEVTSYFSRLLSCDIDLAVDILADILTNSIFDKDELQKEKQVVLQEIGATHDTPDDIVFDYLMNVAFPDQAIGRAILGTKASVSSFKREDFINFMHQHYYAEHMVMVAVGDVNHDNFVKQIEEKFSALPKKLKDNSFSQPIYHGGEKIEHRNLMDAQITLGFKGLACVDTEFYEAQLLSIILGGGMSSRLFQNIREKLGLCYSIYSFHWGFSDSGVFAISAASDKDGVKELLPAIIEELKKLTCDITAEELQRAIQQYKASLIMAQENSFSRAPVIARQLLMYNRIISQEEIFTKLDQTTCKKLQETAHDLFFNSKPSLAAVGPTENLISQAEISSLLKL